MILNVHIWFYAGTSSRLPFGNVTNLKRQTLTSSVSISDASSPMQGTLQSSHFVTLDTQEYNSVQGMLPQIFVIQHITETA